MNQKIGPPSASAIRLLDPDQIVLAQGGEFLCQTFNIAPSSRQRNQLFPECRQIRVPRSRHEKHIAIEVINALQNSGTSTSYASC